MAFVSQLPVRTQLMFAVGPHFKRNAFGVLVACCAVVVDAAPTTLLAEGEGEVLCGLPTNSSYNTFSRG